MSREGREDVVTLVRGDPLLEPPDAGLGGDLADDARHAGVEIRDKDKTDKIYGQGQTGYSANLATTQHIPHSTRHLNSISLLINT